MKKHQIIAASAVVSALMLTGCQVTPTTTEVTTTKTPATTSTASMTTTDKNTVDSMAKPSETTGKQPGVAYVGGAAMYANKDIVSNVVNAPNLTTLVAAVKAAGLVETLSSPGPFTVFGPDNNAFAKLPEGTVDTLVKPENKATLSNILTYHVVPGIYTTTELKDGMTLTTVQGEALMVSVVGSTVTITDSKGNKAKVLTPDVMQKNGVAHVIDTVMMPSK